jgi:hypothetical protein
MSQGQGKTSFSSPPIEPCSTSGIKNQKKPGFARSVHCGLVVSPLRFCHQPGIPSRLTQYPGLSVRYPWARNPLPLLNEASRALNVGVTDIQNKGFSNISEIALPTSRHGARKLDARELIVREADIQNKGNMQISGLAVFQLDALGPECSHKPGG